MAEHFFYPTIGCFNHGNSGLRSTIFKVHKRWQPVQNDDMNEISLIRWPFARIHALTERLYYLASMCLNFKRLQSLLVLWYRKMCTAEEMGWTTKNLKYQFWNTLSMDWINYYKSKLLKNWLFITYFNVSVEHIFPVLHTMKCSSIKCKMLSKERYKWVYGRNTIWNQMFGKNARFLSICERGLYLRSSIDSI